MPYGNFDQHAQGVWDFVRCQRSDGSYYGTTGKCRKGSEVSAKQKEALAKLKPEQLKQLEKSPKLSSIQKKAVKEEIVKHSGVGGAKDKDGEEDAKAKYSSLAKQSQEAMTRGDMATAMKLNKEAMDVMAKINAQSEKKAPGAQEKAGKIDKLLGELKKTDPIKGSEVSSDDKGVYIVNKVGSHEVKTLITPKTDGSYEIGYKVNDSYTKGGVENDRERVRVALTAKRQYDKALSTLPEGTKVRAFAFDDDGGGDVRRAAYGKLGFKHQGNNVMTGVITNGKVEAMDFAEEGNSDVETWKALLFGDTK